MSEGRGRRQMAICGAARAGIIGSDLAAGKDATAGLRQGEEALLENGFPLGPAVLRSPGGSKKGWQNEPGKQAASHRG